MAQLPTLPESAQGVSSLSSLKPVQHGTRKRRYQHHRCSGLSSLQKPVILANGSELACCGARVEITGTQMFGFLDKLTQCVLPRMREFEGINPVGDNSGMMKLTFPDTALGYFPISSRISICIRRCLKLMS
ncbi:hypothetical protein BSLG_010414 [Batrachochytrium salamandrivorans]|nr:hypothetical protein BSLG_010414 [Batrachochytrium salamandrivorans]